MSDAVASVAVAATDVASSGVRDAAESGAGAVPSAAVTMRRGYDWTDRPRVPDPAGVGGEVWATAMGAKFASECLEAAKSPGSSLARVVELAQSRVDDNGSVVMTVVTKEAANDLLVNWLAATILGGGTRAIVLVTFDAESAEFVRSIGAGYMHADAADIAAAAGEEVLRLPTSLGRLGFVSRIWVARYQITIALAQAGINVLQCDLDALLLKPLLPQLYATPADIIAQRGRKPVPMSSQLGSAACGGLTFIRANERALRVLLEGAGGLFMYGDDQSAVAWGLLGGEETPARPLSWWSVEDWYATPAGPYEARKIDHHAQEFRGAAPPVDATYVQPSGMDIVVLDVAAPADGSQGLDVADGKADSPVSMGFLPYREFPRRRCERIAIADRNWIGPHCQGITRGFKGHGTGDKALALADIALWFVPLPTQILVEDATGRLPFVPTVKMAKVPAGPGPRATETEFVAWLTARVEGAGHTVPIVYTGDPPPGYKRKKRKDAN